MAKMSSMHGLVVEIVGRRMIVGCRPGVALIVVCNEGLSVKSDCVRS